MKGNIFDIKRFALHDGPGIRTTCFFYGCPLKCKWCHNPEAFLDSTLVKKYSIDELSAELLKDSIFFEESGGGITFSGGEPLLQFDFLLGMLKRLKADDIHIAVDTTGYTDFSNLERIIPYTDLFLYDIKIIDFSLHERYTGVSSTQIMQNFFRLAKLNVDLRIRIPLIPEVSDTMINLKKVIYALQKNNIKYPIDLLPFNELAESKYERFNIPLKLKEKKTQSPETLDRIKKLFIDNDFEVTIGG